MSDKPVIITTLSQQFEVYAAIKDDPERVRNWEILMKAFGMTDEEFALIKGEQKWVIFLIFFLKMTHVPTVGHKQSTRLQRIALAANAPMSLKRVPT